MCVWVVMLCEKPGAMPCHLWRWWLFLLWCPGLHVRPHARHRGFVGMCDTYLGTWAANSPKWGGHTVCWCHSNNLNPVVGVWVCVGLFGWVSVGRVARGFTCMHAWREHYVQALPPAHGGGTGARPGLLSTCGAVCQTSTGSPLACRGDLRT